MNIRRYIKMILQEILPSDSKEEHEIVYPEDTGPTEEEQQFGMIIIITLIVVLLFLLLN